MTVRASLRQICISCAVFFIAAACTQDVAIEEPGQLSGSDRMERLIAGAKSEGAVSVYSTVTVEDMVLLNDAFEEKYGIAVELWRGSASDILQRATTEARAGRFSVDVIEAPVFYVRGNHAPLVEYTQMGERHGPWGASDLHRRLVRHDGLLIAGFEGCLRYRPGPFQYSQGEMWGMVLAMLPRLLWNRLVRGRALDILVTHAPAWGVGDQPDPAHRGFKAFRWLLKVFRPRYHFHGHIHIYSDDTPVHRRFEATDVINTYGHVETDLKFPER